MKLPHWRRLIRLHRPQHQSDAGFTMLELLIVVVVLPLLIGALATLIITLMQNTVQNDPHGTATRLADSHDAQLTSVYFSRDVQSAAFVSSSTTPLCAPVGAGNEQILGLQWTSGGQTMDVSYFVQQTPNLELIRYYCTSSSPTTPATTSLISDNVFNSTTTATVTPTCPAAPAFGSGANLCAVNSSGTKAYLAMKATCFTRSTNAPVACPGITSNPGTAVNTASTVVATVQITAQESLSSYQYALTASPRGSNPALGIPSNAGVFPPFISNGPVSAGNCTVETNGMMSVNAVSNGSISDGPTGQISASGGIVSSDPSTSQAAASGPGTGTVSPSPVFGITQASPYDGQAEPPTAPSGAGYTVVTSATLPELAGPNWDPSTDTNIESNGVLKSSAGAYPHGAIFIVPNGMKVSKKFSAPQGVLFYVSGGNVDLSGNGSISLNSLSPNFESQPQPAAPEIVLWISKTDTNNPPTLTIGGNGNTTAINGAVYAPSTDVIMNGGGTNGGVSASAFDIGQLKTCNGGGAVPVNISIGFPSSVTTVSPSAQSVALGSNVTATAMVAGFDSAATPSGTVTFYECGPAAAGTCTNSTGIAVGGPVNVSGVANSSPPTSTATSAAFTPLLPGSYCFAAYYSGDGTYPASADTSDDGCFTVTAVDTPVIVTPTDGGCYNANGRCSTRWPGISGTATDTGGPGLQTVQVAIVDSTGTYWNGSSFSATTPDWLEATFTTAGPPIWSWRYSGTITFEAGTNSYTIMARSMDTSGGLSLAASVTISVKG